MKRELLHKLAKEHPDCFHVHISQKEIMSDADGQALLDANFQDISWGNDLAPSFHHMREWPRNLDPVSIFGCQEMDDDENFISAKITWWISDVANPKDDTYGSAQDAIEAFMRLFPMEVNQ